MTKNRTLLRKNPGKQIQNMDFPIVGSKIKVVVEIQDQWKKNELNPTYLIKENVIQKYHIRGKWYFRMVFGTSLSLGIT